MKKVKKTVKLGGRDFTIEAGHIAPQADMAVLAQYGETVVLASVTSSELKEDRGYFPLSVDYQERLYAGGRIKGSRWVKREGRPSDDEILSARVIDRSIRPLFPKGFKKDVQVIVTVLSIDVENDPRIVAANAVSAAIAASPLPWEGPVSVLSIGTDNGEGFVLNTLDSQEKDSQMELIVSSTKDAIVMIEAGAQEAPEEKIVGGIEFAQKEGKALLKAISEFAKEVGNKKEKFEPEKPSDKLVKKVEKEAKPRLPELVKSMSSVETRSSAFSDLVEEIIQSVDEEEAPFVEEILENLKKEFVREMILGGKRPDGRKLDQIRNLNSEVGVLPRTHGSAIFERGATQVLTVATLGSESLGQLIETAEGEEEKHYMHHYSMPPYASGETGRVGSPGRREIGHGALAERALEPVVPSPEEFPYAIRLVSEVTSSNGSTSMASTCGSTLALMDAGVPIKSPVSGIAMGVIVKDAKKYSVLTDIAGFEDFNGDMDFKVAGTKKGVTALQLDVKTLQLTLPILKDALKKAKEGRLTILSSMLKTIKEPRKVVSEHAPKIETLQIPPEKIGDIIGPGGKTIKNLSATTGAEINVEDDGTVSISAVDSQAVQKAIETIENITKEIEPGEIYEGIVKRMENYGAFVEVAPGKMGLVHVSDMAETFVKDPKEIVQLGESVTVRVKEIDNMGRINLSMILDPSKDKKESSGGQRNRNDRNQSGGGRDRRHRNNKGGNTKQGGPHFPASRLVDSNKKY